MKPRLAVLVALVAAVTLTSVAAAGPDAARQRVAITTKGLPDGQFVLTPLQTGALELDSGRTCLARSIKPCVTPSSLWPADRVVMRGGQSVDVYYGFWTFTGKRGSLTIRERSEWVDAGGAPPWAAIGIWKVVRGTGQYAGITGGGRSGHAGLGPKWTSRYEGFLTRS
jgi:hypothetical protein